VSTYFSNNTNILVIATLFVNEESSVSFSDLMFYSNMVKMCCIFREWAKTELLFLSKTHDNL